MKWYDGIEWAFFFEMNEYVIGSTFCYVSACFVDFGTDADIVCVLTLSVAVLTCTTTIKARYSGV